MTHDQAVIAVLILNSYAHQFLGLSMDDVAVAAGEKDGEWMLIVAVPGDARALSFDDAKAVIDGVKSTSVCDADDGGDDGQPA